MSQVPCLDVLGAQGIATSSIRGSVRTKEGAELNGAQVRVLNTATGVISNIEVRRGQFFIQGVEVGGPYIVEVRHIGFVPQRSQPVILTLGEPVELQFVLEPLATNLDTVRVRDSRLGIFAAGSVGAATTIPDSLLHLLPTLNRNFFDFIRLAPQVSTRVGSGRIGASGAGANQRFNNFLINGADERAVASNVSLALNGGKSIPVDAVKEYRVLVSPYDVRYGDFTGVLVNTVTQSGTNQLHGSTFGYWRNDRLARGGDLAAGTYDRWQYGMSLGGPLIRNRVHFFVAPEFQRLTSPAAGVYLGQPSDRRPPVPVSESDITRLDQIMRSQGLTAGSAGLVENSNPLRNVFARIDATLPRWNSRIIAFMTNTRTESPNFARTAPDTFYLSSYKYSTAIRSRLTSFQIHSDLSRSSGGHNELQISQSAGGSHFNPEIRQPIVRVLVPRLSGGVIPLAAGSADQAQGRFTDDRSITVRDELSLPVGDHHIAFIGAQLERYRIGRGGLAGSYGAWTFSSLDSLARGIADRYELQKDFGSATAPLLGGQYALWLGDELRSGQRLVLSAGIRADAWDFRSHAPYNAMVDSIFSRRTDEMPRSRVYLSPRAGFSWDIFGTGRDHLRGGVGLFTGRPPRAWIVPAVSDYGVGIGTLRCGHLPGDVGLPGPFIPDYRDPPTSCASNATLASAPLGDVDLLDHKLRMAQTLRASIAYDRRLTEGFVSTTEVLLSLNRADFMFTNLNLKGPQGVDRNGRVLYGSVSATGVGVPQRKSDFSGVIDLANTSKNYSYQFSTRVEKRLDRGFAMSAAYTYSRVRDVQSPSRINQRGIQLWADARAVSGRHDDMTTGISLNDLPHRVVAALTYAAPWRHRSTEFALHYVGESGSPFTYLVFGQNRRGDLNADGSNANDPVYVPRDAFDSNEIVFSGQSDTTGADNSDAAKAQRIMLQQSALEAFIKRNTCLDRQRGHIMQRNSCREPWSNTTIASVRQQIPFSGRSIEAEFDVFNLLNLVNGKWGRYRLAIPRLLEHVGQTFAPSQPVFRFDRGTDWNTVQSESAFQFQLAVRYRF